MSEETLKEERKEETTAAEEASAAEASAAEAETETAGDTAQPDKQDEHAGNTQEDSKEEGKKDKRRFRKPSKEEEKIEALEKEQAVLNDRYLRLCAEYDNFRKRSQKEKDALYGDVKANAVSAFLPVYDNLERALKQGTEDEAYRKGVEMIMTQFCTTLEKLGVTPIDCLGEKFDPSLHNAVMHVEDEEKGENEIVEVFQKGFKLGDKVIRFAMVKVAN